MGSEGAGAFLASVQAGVCPVTSGKDGREVLAGENYGVAAYGRGYDLLRGRSGHDFANISFALHYLPVAHDGERHLFLRDLASKYLQERNEALKVARQRLAQEAAAVFSRGGRIDLANAVVDQAVTELIRVLSGISIGISPSIIFDAATSLRRRRELDAELGRIIAAMRETEPGIEDDSIGVRLIFAILVNDASRGTLLANLGNLFAENIGRPMAGMQWPPQPQASGIRFIERTAACPVQLAGELIGEGTVMRVDMAAFTRDGDAASLFGIGRHVCLGRGFFWAFWRDLAKALGTLPNRIVAVDIGAVSNRVFAIPDHAFVEVSR